MLNNIFKNESKIFLSSPLNKNHCALTKEPVENDGSKNRTFLF